MGPVWASKHFDIVHICHPSRVVSGEKLQIKVVLWTAFIFDSRYLMWFTFVWSKHWFYTTAYMYHFHKYKWIDQGVRHLFVHKMEPLGMFSISRTYIGIHVDFVREFILCISHMLKVYRNNCERLECFICSW